MYIGKSYKFSEFINWTRRTIYALSIISVAPVILYQVIGLKWLSVPWVVVAVLGTATSFIVGFKNSQAYHRMLAAQNVWTTIEAVTRYWGLISRDFPQDQGKSKILIYRHLAWLTALRYQLRSKRIWESSVNPANVEYLQKFFCIPEDEIPLDVELKRFLEEHEIIQIGAASNRASKIISIQSEMLRDLCKNEVLAIIHYTEMQKTLRDCLERQSAVETLKNCPYPRQYAIINKIFVWSFAALLPFGVIGEFERLSIHVGSFFAGHMCWFAAPFSLFISWLYISLDQVGESTENPFEGGANDVPMAQICHLLEIELRKMLGETDIPEASRPNKTIVL